MGSRVSWGGQGAAFLCLNNYHILNNRHQRMQWHPSRIPLRVMETLPALGTQTRATATLATTPNHCKMPTALRMV